MIITYKWIYTPPIYAEMPDRDNETFRQKIEKTENLIHECKAWYYEMYGERIGLNEDEYDDEDDDEYGEDEYDDEDKE